MAAHVEARTSIPEPSAAIPTGQPEFPQAGSAELPTTEIWLQRPMRDLQGRLHAGPLLPVHPVQDWATQAQGVHVVRVEQVQQPQQRSPTLLICR